MTSWNDFLDDYQGQINDWMGTLVDQTDTNGDGVSNDDNILVANAALNSDAEPLNTPPEAVNDEDVINVQAGATQTIAVADLIDNDTDADGDAFVSIVLGPEPVGGTVTIDNNDTPNDITDDVITFTAGDEAGEASFSYRLNDGTENSNTATVSGVVTPEGGATETVSVTEGNAEPYDASTANVTFEIAQDDYTYTIDGFAEGDVLDFIEGAGLTIINDAGDDGELTVQAAADGSVVEILLTGIPGETDATIFNPDSFEAAFGDALI